MVTNENPSIRFPSPLILHSGGCWSLSQQSGRSLATAHLTVAAGESGRTQAAEAVHLVVAAAAVEARPAGTLVHVALAVLAGETWSAHAVVAFHQVLSQTGDGVGGE